MNGNLAKGGTSASTDTPVVPLRKTIPPDADPAPPVLRSLQERLMTVATHS